MRPRDRTLEVWERFTGDKYDDIWVVIGAPVLLNNSDWYQPTISLESGKFCSRYESKDGTSNPVSWESSPYLKRIA